jgi:hypothetical protein
VGTGLASPPAVAGPPAELAAAFGKAKACILLYRYGAPSQLETFDPKPAAPEGSRGELGTISSIVPGIDVSALLPRLARVMDKVTVVRSKTHPYPNHGVAYALTGIPRIDVPMEVNHRHTGTGRSSARWSSSATDAACPRARGPELPRNLVLPWPFSSQRVGETPRAGPYGGFLGTSYDPIFTEFVGQATRKTHLSIHKDTRWEGFDPYLGITPASRFRLTAEGHPGDRVSPAGRRPEHDPVRPPAASPAARARGTRPENTPGLIARPRLSCPFARIAAGLRSSDHVRLELAAAFSRRRAFRWLGTSVASP